MLVLQLGLRPLLAIGGISPSFLLVLLVFVAMSTRRITVAWASICLGLLVDLTYPISMTDHVADMAIVGPASLGYLVGGLIVTRLRGIVFKDSPIAMPTMAIAAGFFVHLTIVAMLVIRQLPWLEAEPIPHWNIADQLADRFCMVVYTAVWAAPLGFVFVRLRPIWGFSLHTDGGSARPHTRSSR